MGMWIVISVLMLASCLAGVIYLVTRFARFRFINGIAKGKKWLRYILGLVCVLVMCTVLSAALSEVNMIVSTIHLTIIWLLCDLVYSLLTKFRASHRDSDENPDLYISKSRSGIYYPGIAAIIITAVYLGIGVFLLYHVVETDYTIKSDKVTEPMRIVMFADSHVGTSFDGKGLEKYVKEMQDKNPDVVLICGDMVDDGTDLKNMEDACKSLSSLNTKYGVFFSFGNHDKGYSESSRRGYGPEEFISALEENGVTVLQDEIIRLRDDFTIIGRRDKIVNERKTMVELTGDVDMSSFSVVMDHQPGDYNAEAAADVDLVLSGHTHGGQMIPCGLIMKAFHLNDAVYGYEKRNNTNFIVTSGISDWEIKYKTGCISEYVVIDVIPE